MRHKAANKLLLDFLDGDLDSRRKEAVERHLSSCDACREELAGMNAARKAAVLLKTDERPSFSLNAVILNAARMEATRSRGLKLEAESLKPPFWRMMMRPATYAGLAAFVVIALAVLYLPREQAMKEAVSPVSEVAHAPDTGYNLRGEKDLQEREFMGLGRDGTEENVLAETPSPPEAPREGEMRTDQVAPVAAVESNRPASGVAATEPAPEPHVATIPSTASRPSAAPPPPPPPSPPVEVARGTPPPESVRQKAAPAAGPDLNDTLSARRDEESADDVENEPAAPPARRAEAPREPAAPAGAPPAPAPTAGPPAAAQTAPPESRKARGGMAMDADSMEQPEGGEGSVAETAPEQPKKTEAPEAAALFKQARAMERSGNWAGAAKIYRKILKKYPDYRPEEVLYRLGRVYSAQKKYAKAQVYYDKLVKEYPSQKLLSGEEYQQNLDMAH